VGSPLLVSLVCVGVGGLLGLVPGGSARTWAGPVRTFAFVAAMAIALGELLPEAIAGGGVVTLLAFAAGWGVPVGLERLARRLRQGQGNASDAGGMGRWGLEAGYIGLLAHQVVDGLALGTAMGPAFAETRVSLTAAIAAHSVPVAALVAIAYRDRRGLRSALWRVAGLGAAMALGASVMGAGGVAPPSALAPWLSAVVAGMLMHIVVHGWRVPSPTTWPARAMEVLAVAAGLLIVAIPWATHGEGHSVRDDMVHHGLDIALDTAPALLIGLLVAAALQTAGSRLPVHWLTRGRPLGQATRGALLGLPLPVCACGVLPMAHSLRGRGAAPAFVVAFLVATPELGVETFALTARFFGWPFAVVRLLAAVGVAFVAGLVVSGVVRRVGARRVVEHEHEHEHAHAHAHAHEHEHEHEHAHAHEGVPFVRRMLHNFDDLFRHVGPWAVVGIVAAGYTAAALPADAFGGAMGGGVDVLVMTAVAIPSYVCASSATPLAAVLLAKGISPGAILAGLLLGPATNLATLGWLRSAYGARATAFSVGALIATVWAVAAAVNLWMPRLPLVAADLESHAHGWLSHAAALLLVLLLVRAIGRDGLRSWLGSLGESLSPSRSHAEHGHGHGPAPAAPRPVIEG
jgi:uncharacterized protein